MTASSNRLSRLLAACSLATCSLLALPTLSSCGSDDGRYAAWVSFDVGLLILCALLSALVSAALTALFARTNDRRHLILSWLIGFLLALISVVVIMNAVTHYPVFVVETVFPFP